MRMMIAQDVTITAATVTTTSTKQINAVNIIRPIQRRMMPLYIIANDYWCDLKIVSQSNCDDSDSESGRGEGEEALKLEDEGDGINSAPNDLGGEGKERARECGRGVDDESGKGLMNMRDARTHEIIMETSLCRYLNSSMSSSGTAPPLIMSGMACNGTMANLRKIAEAQRK